MFSKNKLVNKFYYSFALNVLGFTLSATICILLVIFRENVINYSNEGIRFGIFMIVLFEIALICANIKWTINILKYCKDLKSVKRLEYKTVTGVVVKYSRYITDDGGKTQGIRPIVKSDDGEETELNIYNVEINRKYKFIYFEHSRIAVAIDIENLY
jgi:hypothetical protein